jgi:regulatory protein
MGEGSGIKPLFSCRFGLAAFFLPWSVALVAPTPSLMRAQAKLSLKARAIQWLSMREHSRVELHRKLVRQIDKERRDKARLAQADGVPVGHDDPDLLNASATRAEAVASVDVLIEELTTLGLLSEARFTESRIRVRAARFGNQRIRGELAQHRITLDPTAQQALKESESSRAYALWQRRFGGEVAADRAERAKQMRFLAGRGFSTDVIRLVVEGRYQADEGRFTAD